jgi:hypothetical protein
MESWVPISWEALRELIVAQVADCSADLRVIFERYRVPPFRTPINRTGKTESVFVVAQKGELVIYYEDVEEGFNLSPISRDGWILDPGCNLDDLELALAKLRDA